MGTIPWCALPCSPRWLALTGRREEAEAALARFRTDRDKVEAEIEEIATAAARTDGGAETTPGAAGEQSVQQRHSVTSRSAMVAIAVLALQVGTGPVYTTHHSRAHPPVHRPMPTTVGHCA